MSGTPVAARVPDRDAARLLAGVPAPRRALFLDRDGVINVDHGYVHAPGQVEWIPGVFALVRDAAQAGYLPVVVTNQAGIARGYYAEPDFVAFTGWMHERFREAGAPLLATFYCPHHPEAGIGALRVACACRKPAPGMFLAAAAEFELSLAASLMVGDTQGDLDAARAAGVGVAHRVHDGALPSFAELASTHASAAH